MQHPLKIKIKRLSFLGMFVFCSLLLMSACGFSPMKTVEVPETRVAGPNLTTTLTDKENNQTDTKADCDLEDENQEEVPTETTSGEQSCDQIINEE